jgi:hypothetical protein
MWQGQAESLEVRSATFVSHAFAARGNRSHLPAENELPTETYRGRERPMSWRRTWKDRDEPSLPRLVREAGRRRRRRADDDHAARVRERLARRYAADTDLRAVLGLPTPPSGRPRRTSPRRTGSVRGRRLADYAELMAECAWDVKRRPRPHHARRGLGGAGRLALPARARPRSGRCLTQDAHYAAARDAPAPPFVIEVWTGT